VQVFLGITTGRRLEATLLSRTGHPRAIAQVNPVSWLVLIWCADVEPLRGRYMLICRAMGAIWAAAIVGKWPQLRPSPQVKQVMGR
jgi:hypothetical protein